MEKEKGNKVVILSPEEMEQLKQAMKERGLESKKTQSQMPEESSEEKDKRQKIRGLQKELEELEKEYDIIKGDLLRLRHPEREVYYPGKQEKRVDPGEIEQLEDQLVELNQQKETLHETLKAVQAGAELPADIGKVLSWLEKRYAGKLSEMSQKSRQDSSFIHAYVRAQQELQAITDLRHRFEK